MPPRNISKITLGCAQLGFKYGIANRTGKPEKEEAVHFLDVAFANGITTLDTAVAYGDSESIIGDWINRSRKKPSIITKIPELENGISGQSLEQHIQSIINNSLKLLKVDKLWGVMLHAYSSFEGYGGKIIQTLENCKRKGLIDHAGISVYNPEELKACVEVDALDIFQIPFNIFDQRWDLDSLADKLVGKRLFARSIFLQGLLLLSPEEAEQKVPGSGACLQKLELLSRKYGISKKTIAFCYARDSKHISSLVIGMEKKEQVSENVGLLSSEALPDELTRDVRKEFINIPAEVYCPALWKK